MSIWHENVECKKHSMYMYSPPHELEQLEMNSIVCNALYAASPASAARCCRLAFLAAFAAAAFAFFASRRATCMMSQGNKFSNSGSHEQQMNKPSPLLPSSSFPPLLSSSLPPPSASGSRH